MDSKAISDSLWDLLQRLNSIPEMKCSYLGGGTALAMEEDHGIRYSKLLFLKGLVDFEEADQEGELPILWDISWKEVKKCLIDEVKHIARKIQ